MGAKVSIRLGVLLVAFAVYLVACVAASADTLTEPEQVFGLGPVCSAAFSPDGQQFLLAGDVACLRRTDTGATIRFLFEQTSRVTSVAFSPNGAQFLTGSVDNSARLWDAATGAAIRTYSGHSDSVTVVAFSPGGTKVLTGSADHSVKLWDAGAGTVIRTFSGHTDSVASVAFSPDGAGILAVFSNGTARWWDAETGADLFTFDSEAVSPVCVAITPDAAKMVTGTLNGGVRVWDAATGGLLGALGAPDEAPMSLAFSPDGTKTLAGYYGTEVKLWNAVTGAQIQTYASQAPPISVACSPDGTKVLAGQSPFAHQIYGNGAMLFDAATAAVIHDFTGPAWAVGHIPAAFSPNGGEIVASTYVWNAATSTLRLKLLGGYTIDVTSARFSPDGTKIVTLRLGADPGVSVSDVATGDPLGTFPAPNLTSAAFSPDGARLLIGSSNTTAETWDAATGAVVQTFSGHTDGVTSVAFSPNGMKVLTGSQDMTARTWDAESGSVLKTLSGHTGGVTSVALSPDGMKVLTGSEDMTARLWDAESSAVFRTFSGHTGGVTSVALSPDGTRIATGSDDGTVKLWSVTTGVILRTFIRSVDSGLSGVGPVSFSPDGTKILTSSYTTAFLWPVPEPLSADFTVNSSLGKPPMTVEFHYSSSAVGGDITDWLWQFGDGETSHDRNPVHTYADEGVYTVSLTVTAAEGTVTATRRDLITVNNAVPMSPWVQAMTIAALLLVATRRTNRLAHSD